MTLALDRQAGRSNRDPLDAKSFTDGTHRVRDPAETVDWVTPLARRCGVTRVPVITGLDRIGIPVTLAIRPDSACLAAESGKGLTLAAAQASALMEAVERYRSDRFDPPAFAATWRELAGHDAVPPVEQLPVARYAPFSELVPENWTWVDDLAGGRFAMPTCLVGRSPERRPWADPLHFQISSNGLSAGNTVLEAVVGGLYEVIERDAVALWEIRRGGRATIPGRVRLNKLPDAAAELVARCRRVGVEPALFDCTSDVGVPTFTCYLIDLQQRHHGTAKGHGAHLDPAVAMTRAITEAAQGRAVWIAGSRDDVLQRDLCAVQRSDSAARRRLLLGPQDRAGGPAHPLPDGQATGTFAGDLDVLLAKLAAVGLHRAGAVDLTDPELGVPVVRVFVPGLEPYRTPSHRPGPRARAAVETARSSRSTP